MFALKRLLQSSQSFVFLTNRIILQNLPEKAVSVTFLLFLELTSTLWKEVNIGLLKLTSGTFSQVQEHGRKSVFYIGSATETNVPIDGFLYADNIASPQPVNLNIKINTTTRTLDLSELDN